MSTITDRPLLQIKMRRFDPELETSSSDDETSKAPGIVGTVDTKSKPTNRRYSSNGSSQQNLPAKRPRLTRCPPNATGSQKAQGRKINVKGPQKGKRATPNRGEKISQKNMNLNPKDSQLVSVAATVSPSPLIDITSEPEDKLGGEQYHEEVKETAEKTNQATIVTKPKPESVVSDKDNIQRENHEDETKILIIKQLDRLITSHIQYLETVKKGFDTYGKIEDSNFKKAARKKLCESNNLIATILDD